MTEKGLICVSGASGGIGAAVVRKLLNSGRSVVQISRRREAMERNIPGADPDLIYTADLSDPQQADRIFSAIARDHPDITAFVHCAGTAVFDQVEHLSTGDWTRVMNVNLNAAFIAARTFIPLFRTIGQGHFIFVNSVAARDIFPQGAAYGVSKAALKSFADHLREECRPDRIAVTSLYPGAVDTPWWNGSDFDRTSMVPADHVAETIYSILNMPPQAVIEDLTLRRIEGNF